MFGGNPINNVASTINVYAPIDVGLKLNFFIVLIKKHPYFIMLDIVEFCNYFITLEWNTGSIFDNNDNFVRTDTQSFDVASNTIFQNGIVSL
jgi:hypothetical protein